MNSGEYNNNSLLAFLTKVYGAIKKYTLKLYHHRLMPLSILLVLVNFTLAFLIVFEVFFARYYWEGESEKRFSVKPGKSLDEVISELEKENILKNPFLFKVVAKLSGKEGKVISRHYIFPNGMNNVELLEMLTDKNAYRIAKFTVIEGLTIKQISRLAERKLFLSPEKFIDACANDSLINILGLKGKAKTLEGFLFPDTYIVPLDIDEKGLVDILFREFMKRVGNNQDIKKKINESKTSLLSAVTLASIVQGETPVQSEMPVISGVYHNRLKKRMKLEADPTVQYALPDGPKTRLMYEDLKINSPYNTYKIIGLPPGPVNNPGFAAINAALNPEKHNYLFFVATGEKGHTFSQTYEEHKIAVKKYRDKMNNGK